MPFFRRDAARKYARWHAMTVCHDGAVPYLDAKGVTKYKRVKALTPYADVAWGTDEYPNDCTHFISCCLGDHDGTHNGKGSGIPGGGLPIKQHDAIGLAYGITGAPAMVKYLGDRGFAKMLGAEKMSRQDATKLMGQMDMGDVIAYAKTKTGGYEHLAMHMYTGHIACHTDCRLDKMWTEIKYECITLLRIVY